MQDFTHDFDDLPGKRQSKNLPCFASNPTPLEDEIPRSFLRYSHIETVYSQILNIDFTQPLNNINTSTFSESLRFSDVFWIVLHCYDLFLHTANPTYSVECSQIGIPTDFFQNENCLSFVHSRQLFGNPNVLQGETNDQQQDKTTQHNCFAAPVMNINEEEYIQRLLLTLGSSNELAHHLRSTFLLVSLSRIILYNTGELLDGIQNSMAAQMVQIFTTIIIRCIVHSNLVFEYYNAAQFGGGVDFSNYLNDFFDAKNDPRLLISSSPIFETGTTVQLPLSISQSTANSVEFNFVHSILPELFQSSTMNPGKGKKGFVLPLPIETHEANTFTQNCCSVFDSSSDGMFFHEKYDNLAIQTTNSATQPITMNKTMACKIPFSIIMYLGFLQCIIADLLAVLNPSRHYKAKKSLLHIYNDDSVDALVQICSHPPQLPSKILSVFLSSICAFVITSSNGIPVWQSSSTFFDIINFMNIQLHSLISFPISRVNPWSSVKSFSVLEAILSMIDVLMPSLTKMLSETACKFGFRLVSIAFILIHSLSTQPNAFDNNQLSQNPVTYVSNQESEQCGSNPLEQYVHKCLQFLRGINHYHRVKSKQNRESFECGERIKKNIFPDYFSKLFYFIFAVLAHQRHPFSPHALGLLAEWVPNLRLSTISSPLSTQRTNTNNTIFPSPFYLFQEYIAFFPPINNYQEFSLHSYDVLPSFNSTQELIPLCQDFYLLLPLFNHLLFSRYSQQLNSSTMSSSNLQIAVPLSITYQTQLENLVSYQLKILFSLLSSISSIYNNFNPIHSMHVVLAIPYICIHHSFNQTIFHLISTSQLSFHQMNERQTFPYIQKDTTLHNAIMIILNYLRIFQSLLSLSHTNNSLCNNSNLGKTIKPLHYFYTEALISTIMGFSFASFTTPLLNDLTDVGIERIGDAFFSGTIGKATDFFITDAQTFVRATMVQNDSYSQHIKTLRADNGAATSDRFNHQSTRSGTRIMQLSYEWSSSMIQHCIELFIELLLSASSTEIVFNIDFSSNQHLNTSCLHPMTAYIDNYQPQILGFLSTPETTTPLQCQIPGLFFSCRQYTTNEINNIVFKKTIHRHIPYILSIPVQEGEFLFQFFSLSSLSQLSSPGLTTAAKLTHIDQSTTHDQFFDFINNDVSSCLQDIFYQAKYPIISPNSTKESLKWCNRQSHYLVHPVSLNHIYTVSPTLTNHQWAQNIGQLVLSTKSSVCENQKSDNGSNSMGFPTKLLSFLKSSKEFTESLHCGDMIETLLISTEDSERNGDQAVPDYGLVLSAATPSTLKLINQIKHFRQCNKFHFSIFCIVGAQSHHSQKYFKYHPLSHNLTMFCPSKLCCNSLIADELIQVAFEEFKMLENICFPTKPLKPFDLIPNTTPQNFHQLLYHLGNYYNCHNLLEQLQEKEKLYNIAYPLQDVSFSDASHSDTEFEYDDFNYEEDSHFDSEVNFHLE